jgi:hypothetical protein
MFVSPSVDRGMRIFPWRDSVIGSSAFDGELLYHSTAGIFTGGTFHNADLSLER